MPLKAGSRGKNIELISVHIPKTAGTSFRNTLVEIYGETAILRVDLPPKNQRDREDPFAEIPATIDSEVRVLHGHFNPTELRQAYPDIPEQTRIITWVRDPVKRVISNYYYLRERIREVISDNPTLNVGVTNRMMKTLLEYAIQDVARNRMAKFLQGTALEEFSFVGVQELYSEDLEYLAEVLEWEKVIEFRHNVTGREYDEVTKEIELEIQRLNQLDWELYQQALELRAIRLNEPGSSNG